jgi:signal transduction protein with GAF and PtsI domain
LYEIIGQHEIQATADAELLVALANQATQVIHNSWLYDAVAHNARKLELLFQVAQSIISTLNPEEILQRVTADACRVMETKVCSLMLLNAERDRLVLRACHGASADYLSKPPLPVGESLIGAVVLRRKPVQVYNVQKHDAFQHIELARQDGLVSLLAVPLVYGDKVLGALSVYSGEPYRFSKQDVNILSTLANLAAVAITNAQLPT